jgi:hypothetical protein
MIYQFKNVITSLYITLLYHSLVLCAFLTTGRRTDKGEWYEIYIHTVNRQNVKNYLS